MRSSRSHVSRGDSAPGSTRSRTVRALRIPRRPLYRSASSSTSAILRCVARASASMAATALPSRYRHAISRAVRAGVVTRNPLMHRYLVVDDPIRPCVNASGGSPIRPEHLSGPAGVDPFRAVHCCGRLAGDHAPAPRPQPGRLERAWLRLVLHLVADRHPDRSRRICCAARKASHGSAAMASLPMNGSAMAEVCRPTPTAHRACAHCENPAENSQWLHVRRRWR